MTEKEFYKMVKELRISKNITQKKMAFDIQIRPSKYNKIENGNLKPSFEEFKRISRYLNINLNRVFEIDKIDETYFMFYD